VAFESSKSTRKTCAVLQGQVCGTAWDCEPVRVLSKGKGERKKLRQVLLRKLHANDEDEHSKDDGVVP
jgi:hypothetical protein